jgi:hypothetical protein
LILVPLDLSDVFGPSVLVLVYPDHGFRVSTKLDIDHSFDTMVDAKEKKLCGSEFWTSVHSEKPVISLERKSICMK